MFYLSVVARNLVGIATQQASATCGLRRLGILRLCLILAFAFLNEPRSNVLLPRPVSEGAAPMRFPEAPPRPPLSPIWIPFPSFGNQRRPALSVPTRLPPTTLPVPLTE